VLQIKEGMADGVSAVEMDSSPDDPQTGIHKGQKGPDAKVNPPTGPYL